MAYKRSLRRRLTTTLALVTAGLLFQPFVASAAGPTEKNRPNLQLQWAQQAQERQDWKLAYEIYADLLTENRDQPKIRERLLFCFRNFLRQYRLNDASYQYHVANLKPSEALEFYRDVLRKVQDNYFDSSKTGLTRLYQEGIVELRLALKDETFIGKHVKRRGKIDEFQAFLRSREQRSVPNVDKLLEEVIIIAQEAVRKLSLNSRVVITEFASGACNALDEYSFYATQGALMSGRDESSTVTAHLLDKSIGYVKILSFQETSTIQEFDTAIERLKGYGMKVLVLDLRDNGGGSLEAALAITERFIAAPNQLASTTGKVNRTYQSFGKNVLEVPVFVLMDGGTASAAELLVAALKAHERAELIGQTTYGKNLIQKMLPTSAPPYGAVRITWAQFYVPKTHDLSKNGGIAPNVNVPVIVGYMGDRQMDVALERARTVVAMR